MHLPKANGGDAPKLRAKHPSKGRVVGVRADRMSKAHPIPAQPSTYCQAKLGNGVKGNNAKHC
jgi:hypothetical protein